MSEAKKRHPRRTDQEWIDIICECRSSGMTDKAWCETHHISPSKLYYHIRRLRNKSFSLPDNPASSITNDKQEIVKLDLNVWDNPLKPVNNVIHEQPASTEPAIRLNLYGCLMEINNSAASETIRNTLAALQSLC